MMSGQSEGVSGQDIARTPCIGNKKYYVDYYRCSRALEASWPENSNPELLFQSTAEAIFHLRTLVIRWRRTLIVRLRFDAQSYEIRALRGDDLGHHAVKIGKVIDRDGLLDTCAAGDRGVICAALIDHRHRLDRLVALVVDDEVLQVFWLLSRLGDQATGIHAQRAIAVEHPDRSARDR